MHPTGRSARYDKAGALLTDAGSNVPSLMSRNGELDMFPQVETGAGGLQVQVFLADLLSLESRPWYSI